MYIYTYISLYIHALSIMYVVLYDEITSWHILCVHVRPGQRGRNCASLWLEKQTSQAPGRWPRQLTLRAGSHSKESAESTIVNLQIYKPFRTASHIPDPTPGTWYCLFSSLACCLSWAWPPLPLFSFAVLWPLCPHPMAARKQRRSPSCGEVHLEPRPGRVFLGQKGSFPMSSTRTRVTRVPIPPAWQGE